MPERGEEEEEEGKKKDYDERPTAGRDRQTWIGFRQQLVAEIRRRRRMTWLQIRLAAKFAKWLTHIAVTMELTKTRSSIPTDDVGAASDN